MKYLNAVRRIFPNRTCTVRFTENYRGIEVEIRVDDYFMLREFPSDELAGWSSERENLIDQEFEYMLEAIEGKFNSDKEKVQIWREKMKKYRSGLSEEKFIEDLKKAGFSIKKKNTLSLFGKYCRKLKMDHDETLKIINEKEE